jgi:hypothetical protein
MHDTKQPGARWQSDRAVEIVLGRTLPSITSSPDLQHCRRPVIRIVGWRVTRWLGVERVEVNHGR